MIRKGFQEKKFRHFGAMMRLILIRIKKQVYAEEMTVILCDSTKKKPEK
jgi:hypothetical protein